MKCRPIFWENNKLLSTITCYLNLASKELKAVNFFYFEGFTIAHVASMEAS